MRIISSVFLLPLVDSINIVSVLDATGVEACLLKLFSIFQSTTKPQQLRFYTLIMNSSIAQTWNRRMSTVFPGTTHEMKSWVDVKPTHFPQLSQRGFDTDYIYARFYLPLIFPVGKFIYLDNDIIVNADLDELFHNPLQGDIYASIIPKRYHHQVNVVYYRMFD